jgi:hypothetical protein
VSVPEIPNFPLLTEEGWVNKLIQTCELGGFL